MQRNWHASLAATAGLLVPADPADPADPQRPECPE